MRTKLLQKYRGLIFFDDVDNNNVRMTISKHKLEWFRGLGWFAMTEPPEYDGTNNHILEPIQISEDQLIILISNTEQPDALNVRMVWKKNNEYDIDDSTNNNTNDDTNNHTD